MNLRSFSTLQIALGVSFAVHAVLLTVRFVDPEGFNRVFEDTPLEVILVNTNTKEKADKALAIAQTSLAGGGDAAKGRATSPLPPSALTEIGRLDRGCAAADRSDAGTADGASAAQEARRCWPSMPPPEPKQANEKPKARRARKSGASS